MTLGPRPILIVTLGPRPRPILIVTLGPRPTYSDFRA